LLQQSTSKSVILSGEQLVSARTRLILSLDEFTKLSTIVMSYPASIRQRTVCDPMNPEPPVTRMRGLDMVGGREGVCVGGDGEIWEE
jgi:hypothetical protein